MAINGLRKTATFRLCNVSSFKTELLEIRSENPSLHILFIPGNPGVITFYIEFVEAIYEFLEDNATVTAIGHVSHTKENWEPGRLFSLQDQIHHKVEFIKQEFQNSDIPIILVGHSVGSYISLEVFKRFPQKVTSFIGLYPFLTLNKDSAFQSMIGKIAMSHFLSSTFSSLTQLMGFIPIWASKPLVRKSIGKSWSSSAVEATCGYLLKYHTVRNALFMAKTEFEKLSEDPDWEFMRGKKDKMAFLFGNDDHWGPLSLFEEISKQVPGLSLAIETEGHKHAFSCTEAGSVWVARHVVNFIRRYL